MDRAWLGVFVAMLVTGCGGTHVPVIGTAEQTKQHQPSQADVMADAELSRNVRRTIFNDELMSVEARNLYVRTQNGVVTLRGAVTNEQERATVRTIAEQIAGPGRVNDAMQVISQAVAERFSQDPIKTASQADGSFQ
jgi:osmotically-inducible protein OsmY